MKQSEWGLVLSGGGGKGAFEAGVILGMHQEIKNCITAVAGASVGALNAVLFAIDEPGMVGEIWSNITAEDVFTLSLSKFTENFDPLRDGIFERDGLKNIIHRYNILDKFKNTRISTYISLSKHEADRLVPKFELLNNKAEDELMDLLMATSALPIIFGAETTNGATYSDGGLTGQDGNVPIEPLYQAGYRKMIVVHLHNEYDATEAAKDRIQLAKYADCTFIHIYPHVDMGSLLGTLNFNPGRIRELMALGQMEVQNIVHKFVQILFDEKDAANMKKIEFRLMSAYGDTAVMDYYKELVALIAEKTPNNKPLPERMLAKTELLKQIEEQLDHFADKKEVGELVKAYLLA